MTEVNKGLILEIITPQGVEARVKCDSVQLTMADDENGRGKGSYGIRRGHTSCVLLLAQGTTTAQTAGREVFRANTAEGFATVDKNTVSVVVQWANTET